MNKPTRNGKPLKTRSQSARLSDAKNAWRNMDPEHRKLFTEWAREQGYPVAK
jgi:hypothetical protein